MAKLFWDGVAKCFKGVVAKFRGVMWQPFRGGVEKVWGCEAKFFRGRVAKIIWEVR